MVRVTSLKYWFFTFQFTFLYQLVLTSAFCIDVNILELFDASFAHYTLIFAYILILAGAEGYYKLLRKSLKCEL